MTEAIEMRCYCGRMLIITATPYQCPACGDEVLYVDEAAVKHGIARRVVVAGPTQNQTP